MTHFKPLSWLTLIKIKTLKRIDVKSLCRGVILQLP